jgi:FtsP/CotA-like multicopper oxidase with cupredoxin domain
VDDNTGKSAMFGPTIRVPRGSVYNIQLTNNLVQQTPVGEVNWCVVSRGRDSKQRSLAMQGLSTTLDHTSTHPTKNASSPQKRFNDLGHTSLHTHGMHAETGVMSQDTASTYVFGDNPFFTLKGKETPASTPNMINFGLAVPPTHMPGLHFYHPHQHGATSTQVTMSQGAIVIEVRLRGARRKEEAAETRLRPTPPTHLASPPPPHWR